MSTIQPVWSRTQADLHQLVDGLGARPAGRPRGRWPRRRRPRGRSGRSRTSQASLPTVRISFTPGAALATKSKAAGQRADAGEQRHAAAGAAGTPSATPRCPSPSRTARARPPGARTRSGRSRRSRPGCPWRRPRTSSVRLPWPAAEQAERGGDAGLADAALAGDEEQPPVEQLEVTARAGVTGRRSTVASAAPKPMRRSLSGLPSSM